MIRFFRFNLILPFFIAGCAQTDTGEHSETEVTQVTVDTIIEQNNWTPPNWDLENIQFQDDFEGCLPQVNSQLIAWKNSDSLFHYFPYDYDNLYMYLSTHLDSSSTKIVTETDSIWGVISWEQYFSGGIKYKSIYHPEAGSSAQFKTNCEDMAKVRAILYPIIETEDNYWNDDSTSYGPDGAGCYYDFSRDSLQNTINIDSYCGC